MFDAVEKPKNKGGRPTGTGGGQQLVEKIRGELTSAFKILERRKKPLHKLLADQLDNYAETGKEYTKILKQIINQNSLKDFDDVKLMPLSVKYKNLI